MLARVFARRTNATPDDEYAFVGFSPAILRENITEIHISLAFSFDRDEAEYLHEAWSEIAPCSVAAFPTSVNAVQVALKIQARNGG